MRNPVSTTKARQAAIAEPLPGWYPLTSGVRGAPPRRGTNGPASVDSRPGLNTRLVNPGWYEVAVLEVESAKRKTPGP